MDFSNDEYLDEGSSRLTSGLDLREVRGDAGATFEIDTSENDVENGNQYFYGEELLKYTKSEIDGFNSDEDEENDSDRDLMPFEKVARRMEDVSPNQDGLLLKEILKPGTGNVVEEKSKVSIHYNAYNEYDSDPYDSTYLRHRPFQFRLGEGTTFDGLELAVATMRLKEKAQFLIKPELAFGQHGCPPRIPENATLLFEVTLIDCIDDSAAEEFRNLSIEEQNVATVSEVLKVARAENVKGNNFVKEKNFRQAIFCYKRAIRYLEFLHYANEKEENDGKAILLKLYLNLCYSNLELGFSRRVISSGIEALKIDPKCAKALFRLGVANMRLGELKLAKNYLIRAAKLEPNDPAIKRELEELNKRQADYKAAERSFSQLALSQPVNQEENQSNLEVNSQDFDESVSDDFRNLVIDTLNNFKQNSNINEMFLPSYNNCEVSCVAACVKVLGGLRVEFCRDSRIKITKI